MRSPRSVRRCRAWAAKARQSIDVSLRDLRLAPEVDVDLVDAQALARRLIAPGTSGLAAADLSAGAITTLSAELLPDWYDEWAVVRAEDWRQLRVHALEAMAAQLTDDQRFADATAAALAAVHADPLRETAQAALMRVHLAEGNPSEALIEFHRYRALLMRELGLEPTPRLGELLAAAGVTLP